MNYLDAIKVCSAVQWADGGCSVCVRGIMDDLVEAFPDIDWKLAYKEREAIVPDYDPEEKLFGAEWPEKS